MPNGPKEPCFWPVFAKNSLLIGNNRKIAHGSASARLYPSLHIRAQRLAAILPGIGPIRAPGETANRLTNWRHSRAIQPFTRRQTFVSRDHETGWRTKLTTKRQSLFRRFRLNPSLLFQAQRLCPQSGGIPPCSLNEFSLLDDEIAGNYGANARLSPPAKAALSH